MCLSFEQASGTSSSSKSSAMSSTSRKVSMPQVGKRLWRRGTKHRHRAVFFPDNSVQLCKIIESMFSIRVGKFSLSLIPQRAVVETRCHIHITPISRSRETTNISFITPNQQKKPEPSSLGKLPFLSLDLSHQMSVIWLIHGLRRTRRDLNSGFITKCSRGMSVSRYTTQPITVTKGNWFEYIH